ncbi:PREDICTED: spermatogenesis-associated protein 31E1-like isoform X1 [Chinchilla lanigera]|uniref:spermatogenesis-associated protein 31E1-like isoform X1 n=1 Tax=Chinchilla lanigera TaxID=34839 RepID=UPI0006985FA4|nr:PREDICTED: spermatogenesis-associated protein 31E1-like isoform X1 [Chinchilla lanigera]
MMMKFLFLLKYIHDTWKSPSSTTWATDTSLALGYGLVHFALFISHFRVNQSTPITGKKNSREHHRQKRWVKSKKSCSLKGRSCSRISPLCCDPVSVFSWDSLNGIKAPQVPVVLLQSHVQEFCDKGRLQQHSNGAILGEEFKPGPARVHRPYRHFMEDPSPNAMCLLASLAPGTQNLLPLASSLLAGPHKDLMRFLLGPSPRSSCLGQLDNCYLPSLIRAISGPDHYQSFILFFSWSCTTTNTLFIFTWAHGQVQQGHYSYSPPDPCHWQGEHRGLCFNQANVNSFLLITVIYKLKIITSESRLPPGISGCHVQVQGVQGIMAQPFWNTQGQSELLLRSQQLSYCTVSGDNLDHRCNQLSWNLICLYRESLVTTTYISNRPSLLHQFIKFHGFNTQFLLQFLAEGPPQLSQTAAFSEYDFSVNQLRFLTQNKSPSLPQGQTRALIHYDFSVNQLRFLTQNKSPSLPQGQTRALIHYDLNVSQLQFLMQNMCPSLPQGQTRALIHYDFNANKLRFLTQNKSPSLSQDCTQALIHYDFNVNQLRFLTQNMCPSLPQSHTRTLIHYDLNVNQLQLLTQSMSSSMSQGQARALIPCSLQNPPPSSLSWIRACTTTVPTTQLKAQYFISKENKYLEWPLQKLLKQRMVCISMLQKAREATSKPTLDLPLGSQASQTPKLAAIFPEYSKNQVQEKQVPTQPSAPSCKGSRSVQETNPWCSDSLLKKGLSIFQLKDSSDALQQEPEDQMQSLGITSQKVQGDDSKYSESNFKKPGKGDAGSHCFRNSYKKHPGKHLQEHLVRKLGQMHEGLVPVCVRKSWLYSTNNLPVFNTYTQSRHLAYAKGQETHVETSQELPFFNPKTCLLHEAHIKRSWLRRRWRQYLQAPPPINIHIGERVASHFPLPTFTSLTSSGSNLIAEVETILDQYPQNFTAEGETILNKYPQKVPEQEEVTQISLNTPQSPLPASPGAHDKMQSPCSEILACHHCWPSEALPTTQNGDHRSPCCINRLLDRICQGSTALGLRKERLGSSPSSTMARFEPQKNNCAVPSGETCHNMVTQEVKVGCQLSMAKMSGPTKKRVDYGRPKEKEQEEKYGGERPSHDFELNPPAKVRETDTRVRKFFLHLSKKKQAVPPTKGEKKMKFLQFLKPKKKSKSKGQENSLQEAKLPSTTNQQEESNRSQLFMDSKEAEVQALMTVVGQILVDKLGGCHGSGSPEVHRCEPVTDQQEESNTNQLFVESTVAEVQEILRIVGQILVGKLGGCHGSGPPEVHCPEPVTDKQKSNVSQFFRENRVAEVQAIIVIVGQILVDKLGGCYESAQPEVHWRKPVTDQWEESNISQLFVENRVAEVQAIMAIVGQILVDKLGCCQGSGPSKLHRQKPVCKCSCYDRINSNPDKRREMREMASGRQARTKDHSHTTGNGDCNQALVNAETATPTTCC